MTAAIEIYTRPGCGYCTAAKSLLTRKNAAFTELNVASDPAYREQMYDRAGHGAPAMCRAPSRSPPIAWQISRAAVSS